SQLLNDLKQAAVLLPSNVESSTRPSKAAAFGLLSRTYLSMGKYEESLKYADSCLRLHPKLMDYNSLDPAQSFPIPRFNEETIFYGTLSGSQNLRTNTLLVDTILTASYHDKDLRKT